MRRPALAAAALVLAAGAAIASEPEVFHVEDPARWGTPGVVVEPEGSRPPVVCYEIAYRLKG